MARPLRTRPVISSRVRIPAVLAMSAIGLGCVVLSGVTWGGLPALGTTLWIANLLGWCSFLLLLLLLMLPLRRRHLQLTPLIAHSTHRRAGYLVLVLVIVHAAVSVLGEPESIRYWLPTAPLYMLLGQASVVALAVLCWMAARSVRARRYGTGSHFHQTHLLLSFLVLALSFAHAAGSAAIPFSTGRMMPWAILSAAAALWPLRSAGRD
jgi:ferric reductase like protein